MPTYAPKATERATTHNSGPTQPVLTAALSNSEALFEMASSATESAATWLGEWGAWADTSTAAPDAVELLGGPPAVDPRSAMSGGEAYATNSGTLALSLAQGDVVASSSRTRDIGPVRVTGGANVNLSDAAAGGSVGITKDGNGFGVNGGVDLGSDGIEGLSAGGMVGLGPVQAGVGAGILDKISAPQKTDDGMYEVIWRAGLGAGQNAGIGKVGVAANAVAAEVSRRSFDTLEEADAFRTKLAAQDAPAFDWSAEAMEDLDPGEKISRSTSAGIGAEGSTATLMGVTLGGSAQLESGVEIEKLANGNVQVERKSSWNIGAKAGWGTYFGGHENTEGFGHTSELAVEFDLEKPGVAAVFDEFQRTGELPEKLPEGVMVDQGKDVDTRDWGVTSWLGPETVEKKGGTEVGTYRDGDLQGAMVRGHSSEVETRQHLGRAVVSYEAHDIEVRETEKGQVAMVGTSEYQGRGATAKVADHLSITQGYENTMHNGMQGGHYKVNSSYSSDTRDQLGEYACGTLVPDYGPGLQLTEGQQQPTFDEFAVDMCIHDDDNSGIAQVVAEGGRDAQELLMANTRDDITIVEDLNSPAFPGAAVHERIEHKISLLEHADQVDPFDLDTLERELEQYRDATRDSNYMTDRVVRDETKRLTKQLKRIERLRGE